MTGPITQEELSAFIDGELPPDRAASLREALHADATLAAREAALRRDRDLLAQAYAPLAHGPLPAAWLARIEDAVEPPFNVLPFPRRKTTWTIPLGWAAAACLALVFGAAVLLRAPAGDAILREATLARTGQAAAMATLADAALPPPDRQRALLREATGLPVRAPDLHRLGWQLAALTTYPGAAQLRYRNGSGAALTMYVRRSTGAPRFDLLRNGTLRVCVWQDEVVGAVIMGEMQAGQMMRVAGAAYADLDL
jgi:anti-sigma factor RsiW